MEANFDNTLISARAQPAAVVKNDLSDESATMVQNRPKKKNRLFRRRSKNLSRILKISWRSSRILNDADVVRVCAARYSAQWMPRSKVLPRAQTPIRRQAQHVAGTADDLRPRKVRGMPESASADPGCVRSGIFGRRDFLRFKKLATVRGFMVTAQEAAPRLSAHISSPWSNLLAWIWPWPQREITPRQNSWLRRGSLRFARCFPSFIFLPGCRGVHPDNRLTGAAILCPWMTRFCW